MPLFFASFSASVFQTSVMDRPLFYYLLIIHRISSIVTQYETSSSSSQFMDLENLIGSLHTYAPNGTQLIVHDMGLTSGQQKLLKRYENIQIVLSTYTPSTNIDVHHE